MPSQEAPLSLLGATLCVTSILGCGGGDPAGTGGAQPKGGVEIAGSWLDRRATESGQVLVPVDLSNEIISADIEDSPNRWHTQYGKGDKDGKFTIPNVPDGPFYLGVTRNGVLFSKYYTTEHQIDLGSWVTGRPDAVPTPFDHRPPLAISSNLAIPWSQSTRLDLLSIEADGSGENSVLADLGVTSVAGLLGEWQSGGLADASKGDTTYLVESSFHTAANGLSYVAVDGAGSSTSLTVDPTATAPTPVSFTMVASDNSESSVVQAHTGAFRALTLDNPLVSTSDDQRSPEVSIIAGPHAADAGLIGSFPGLVSAQAPTPDGDVDLTLSYGNPFPTSWSEVLQVRFPTYAGFTINNHPAERGGAFLITWQMVPMSPTLTDVSPMLGPVTHILVNGQDASVPTDLTTDQLTLSWDPPSLGTPTLYQVDSYRVDDTLEPGKTVVVFGPVFTTSLTKVDLYPFEDPGDQNTYAFVISARMAGTQAAARPNLTTLPDAMTPTVTNAITVHQ